MQRGRIRGAAHIDLKEEEREERDAEEEDEGEVLRMATREAQAAAACGAVLVAYAPLVGCASSFAGATALAAGVACGAGVAAAALAKDADKAQWQLRLEAAGVPVAEAAGRAGDAAFWAHAACDWLVIKAAASNGMAETDGAMRVRAVVMCARLMWVLLRGRGLAETAAVAAAAWAVSTVQLWTGAWIYEIAFACVACAALAGAIYLAAEQSTAVPVGQPSALKTETETETAAAAAAAATTTTAEPTAPAMTPAKQAPAPASVELQNENARLVEQAAKQSERMASLQRELEAAKEENLRLVKEAMRIEDEVEQARRRVDSEQQESKKEDDQEPAEVHAAGARSGVYKPRLEELRREYLGLIEHRINNPVQSIVYVMEEINALVSTWTYDEEEKSAEPRSAGSPRSPRSPRLKVANDSDEPGNASITEDRTWEHRVAEFNSLSDMALSALDGLLVTCRDMHEGLLCDSLDKLSTACIKQPTNVEWVVERCEHALNHFQESERAKTGLTSVFKKFEVESGLETCVTDSMLLFSLLLRFASNAQRFVDEGVVNVCVSTRAARPRPERPADRMTTVGPDGVVFCSRNYSAEGRSLRIEVRDTGSGVSPDLWPLLFTIPPKSEKYGGFGLFLSSCAIERLNGMCGYEPNEGSGSVFWFEVPYVPTSKQAACRAPPRLLRVNVQNRRPRTRLITNASLPLVTPNMVKSAVRREDESAKRILIIEDEKVQSMLLKKRVESMGYQVDTACDGVEGLKMMKANRYRVVLCDKIMPRMSGHECVQAFRTWESKNLARRNRPQFICGLSANREPSLPPGFDLYLGKPTRRDDLCRLLEIDNNNNDDDDHLHRAAAGRAK